MRHILMQEKERERKRKRKEASRGAFVVAWKVEASVWRWKHVQLLQHVGDLQFWEGGTAAPLTIVTEHLPRVRDTVAKAAKVPAHRVMLLPEGLANY